VLNTAEKTVLLTIDMQERLAPAVDGIQNIVDNVSKLIQVASLLDIPIIFTEHYSKGLGNTLAELTTLVAAPFVVNKINFSAVQEREFTEYFDAIGRDRVIVSGTEAHVCVMQTSLDLVSRGFRPFVVEDAIGSRNNFDKHTAIERMRDEGIGIVSTEMVLFEWVKRADHPAFRKILSVIKSVDHS